MSSEDIKKPLPLSHSIAERLLLAMPEQEEIELSQVDGEELRGRIALLERMKDRFWTRCRNELIFFNYEIPTDLKGKRTRLHN